MRKMLGDINSQECIALMQLIETQSKDTLAAWAVNYVKENYLEIYEAECPEDFIMRDTITSCEDYLLGSKKLDEVKLVLKAAVQVARDIADNPVAQAAARAISTACATIQTPTNSLGFVFYGAATVAYSKEGLTQPAEIYDVVATQELKKAFASLQQVAVTDEKNPEKIKWGC